MQRDGRLEWTALGFGSAGGKVRMETKLAGPGAEARVSGGYAGAAGQHLDYDTTQEHAAPNTSSVSPFGRPPCRRIEGAVWRGMIKVDPGAQQTDASPGEPQPAALSPMPTPTQSPGLRSSPTTFAAPMQRQSRRLTEISSFT